MEGFWYLFGFDPHRHHYRSSRGLNPDGYPPPPRPKSYVRVRRSKRSGRKKLEHVRPRPRPRDSYYYSPEWPRDSCPSSRLPSDVQRYPRDSYPSSHLTSDVERHAYGVQRPAPALAIPGGYGERIAPTAIPGAYGERATRPAFPGATYGERAPLGGKPGWEIIEPRDPEMGRPVVVDLRGR